MCGLGREDLLCAMAQGRVNPGFGLRALGLGLTPDLWLARFHPTSVRAMSASATSLTRGSHVWEIIVRRGQGPVLRVNRG